MLCLLLAVACSDPPAQPSTDAAPKSSGDAADATDDAEAMDVVNAMDAVDEPPPASSDVADVARQADAPGDDGARTPDVSADRPVDAPRDAVGDGLPPIIDDECQPPVATITVPGPEHSSTMTFLGISWVSRVCGQMTAGPEGHYTLQATARTVVSVAAGRHPAGIRRNCNDRSTEFACAQDSSSIPLRALLEPGTYSLVVDGTNAGANTVDLRVTSATPAPNGACEAPTEIPLGATLSDQNTAGAWVSHCWPIYYPTLRYRVTIPPRRAALVTVQRAAPGSGVLTLREAPGCSPTATCGPRYADTIGTTQPFTLGFNNDTDAPARQEVVVAQSSGDAIFSIGAQERSLGGHCTLRRPLAAGATMSGLDVRTGGTSNFGWCLAALGPQLFFETVVPLGQRLTVTATPTGSPWAPTVQLVPTCGGTTCYAIRSGTAGAPTVATYEARAAETRVIIGVAAPEGTTGGTFDLSATLTPL